ncbi:glucose 1-dehydrogenase [Limisalsivibrio acetivorans]|uniref:glucose 1-dehydrogenase n=1 Tax=Limisalsivibrio acetivorans TaxID=1304888 RepID=UPI0003B3C8AF|nr:glucose 1-dehydrogenase [Limisalsivibrio acetivorans]
MEKTVIVTGGAQGIGFSVAEKLYKEGWYVLIADKDPEACKEAMEYFKDSESVLTLVTDVSDEGSVERCVQTALEHFGRLNGLVNNAGIAEPDSGPVKKLSLDDWNRVIGTNLTGAFLMAKYAAPHIKKHNGSIVNISSTRALQSEKNSEAYAASKGGLLALTHSLAVSLGPKVRVNAISPGWINASGLQKSSAGGGYTPTARDHKQHPAGRVGRPEDIAEMVSYLLSDRAGFITGQNFVIDGGMTVKMIYEE